MIQTDVVGCTTCCALCPTNLRHCPTCRTRLHARKPDSLQTASAWLITGAILYIPANLLPIMRTSSLASASDSTILQGVVLLWNAASYPTALVIFVASVVIPLAKILALAWLCWGRASRNTRKKMGKNTAIVNQRMKIYQITEFIGPWSMVDVFVVALLVALIQFSGVLTVQPGAAALAFAGMVVATKLAADAFDSRLLWDEESRESFATAGDQRRDDADE